MNLNDYLIPCKNEDLEKSWLNGDPLPGENELPAVTTSDNGDVLTVVSGAWAKAAPSGGLPAVSASDNGDVLTVVEGAWQKAAPSGGVNIIDVSTLSHPSVENVTPENVYWFDDTFSSSNYSEIEYAFLYNFDPTVNNIIKFTSEVGHESYTRGLVIEKIEGSAVEADTVQQGNICLSNDATLYCVEAGSIDFYFFQTSSTFVEGTGSPK